MKKTYQKPNIIFEDFTLSTSIASGCENKALYGMYMCAYLDEELGFTIFNSTVGAACTLRPEDDGDNFNGLCYHVPVESNNIFAS